MFSLPEVGDRKSLTANATNRVTIQDDPVVFALLLDVVYQDVDTSYMTLKEQLQLALLAHKYEMRTIQAICQTDLALRLPRVASTRDFSLASSYEDDPSIAPLVIRVGELLDMPELLPWAMYHFAIQSEASDCLSTEEDILFL
ncbi:hypothetical protein FRC12_006850 [Ceratobasidium sp. 428]|nr:hypothetical protein FRC12_006850 [Ceratobasidium sp. 428]